MKYKKAVLSASVAAVVVGGSIAAVGIASASVPAPQPANVNVVPAAPRIVAPPGVLLNAGQTVTIQVAGRTFGSTHVPNNTTGVTVSISSINPSEDGQLTVWTTEVGRPGTPSVNYAKGQSNTNVVTVGLNSQGRINVYSSAATRFVMALMAFNTPDHPVDPACNAALVSIPKSTKTLTNVGGSIRTGATDFGSITLPRGVYDTRVIGGFTGLNNTDTWLPSGVFLTGTLIVVKGDTIDADFGNDVTAGGVILPKSDSATLTQDPTVEVSTFLVLNTATRVHVQLFAYASNSGTAGSGQVKANVQSAQFRRVC